MPCLRLAIVSSVFLAVVACAEPPHKEMNQAQGAIEAARAAGAERYAPEELEAAVAALTRAQEAVVQRDYRLALNHALDSREQAQNAAKQAADQKAAVRSDAERLLNEVTASLVQARARLAEAEAARTPHQRLRPATDKMAAAESAVQKARAALKREDYLTARADLSGALESARTAIDALNRLPASRPPRRRG